ncbi:MAG TPA: hypothetical protein VIK92_06530 [Thermaerobacter sp.]
MGWVTILRRLAGAVLAGLGVAGLTALVVWLWPGPFSRSGLSLALALEAVLVLAASLNYSGFLWGRRTFYELITGQPQPPPEELERRNAWYLWLVVFGATLFAAWLVVG